MNDIGLHRASLVEMRVDALAYGAKDTGEMGGGAAAAVLAAAGPEILDAVRKELAGRSRQIGDAVITDAFALGERGVKWVVHVLSIIKNTPQGAWCPEPEKLRDGVMTGLRLAAGKGAGSIAFSMLGTGEGRVKPPDAARIMVCAIRDFQRSANHPIAVHFALPTPRDFEAVERYLSL